MLVVLVVFVRARGVPALAPVGQVQDRGVAIGASVRVHVDADDVVGLAPRPLGARDHGALDGVEECPRGDRGDSVVLQEKAESQGVPVRGGLVGLGAGPEADLGLAQDDVQRGSLRLAAEHATKADRLRREQGLRAVIDLELSGVNVDAGDRPGGQAGPRNQAPNAQRRLLGLAPLVRAFIRRRALLQLAVALCDGTTCGVCHGRQMGLRYAQV